MKGFVLPYISTSVAVLFFVAVIIGAVFVSFLIASSQATQVGAILSSTEQPLSIVSGLVHTKLPDGRTLLDSALHSLGRAQFRVPSQASNAIQEWGIESWQMTVSGSRNTQSGVTTFEPCGPETMRGICSGTSNCPAGSLIVPRESSECGGKFCCKENYDFSDKRYPSGTQCGPDGGYYGVCEPGGCSLGRKNMGQLDCAVLPIGNYCCRPFTGGESITVAQIYTNSITIPLLYPRLFGNLTIDMSSPQNILGSLRS